MIHDAALDHLRKRMMESMKELTDIEMILRDGGMKKSGYIVGDATVELDKALRRINRAMLKRIEENNNTG